MPVFKCFIIFVQVRGKTHLSLKIVHMTTVHGPNDIRIFEKECLTLAANGYDVSFVVPVEHCEGIQELQGVKIVPVKKAAGRAVRMLITGFYVFRKAMSLNPDICHIHDPELLIWVPLMRMSGKRVVYDMHECIPKSVMIKPWIPPFMRKCVSEICRMAERVLAKGVLVIFAEESYIKEYTWVRNSEVILNMPKSDYLLSIDKLKRAESIMAYVGAISADRGLFVTIDVLRLLKERGVLVKWLLIGSMDSADKAKTESLINQYALKDHVRICGYIEPRRAWQMIAGCFCGLATLLPRANYFESYPTKMFEYMALGIPVIVSDFPMYRSVVEKANCGICVNPEKPLEIADAVEKLLSQPDLALQMGKNGRQAVCERFNWSNEAQKLLNVYGGIKANVRNYRTH